MDADKTVAQKGMAMYELPPSLLKEFSKVKRPRKIE